MYLSKWSVVTGILVLKAAVLLLPFEHTRGMGWGEAGLDTPFVVPVWQLDLPSPLHDLE